ncbi:haloacid dehalogenase type II [Arthrobacter sp. USHLN218]|uniref:haloacid dehalogenase type II n=1 Tax=Arthrobacter sp. USHLN218 TaxID=3081232 RepID=UPI003018003C
MPEVRFRPKYISFDCYGTLIHFQMREAVEPFLIDRLSPAELDRFFALFRMYRFDEILQYAPYDEVLEASYRRTCGKFGLEAETAAIKAITSAVLGWGPHADVPAPLAKMAEHFPLVILSNADDRHLAASVPKLGGRFHAVLSAEQAGAYKPRAQAFEYMFDTLDASPADFLHISAHQRYDIMPAFDLGIHDKVFLNRGYDPEIPHYEYLSARTLDDVNAALGI